MRVVGAIQEDYMTGGGPYNKSIQGECGHTTRVHGGTEAIQQEYMVGLGPYNKST